MKIGKKEVAIYHFHVTKGTKSDGQSGLAKSDYITRTGSYNKDIGEVLYQGYGNMPAWVTDSKSYWENADIYLRDNAVLFRQAEFSLPQELSDKQRVVLAKKFADRLSQYSVPESEQDEAELKNLPYSFAIHRGKGKNPHCHLMLSELINDGHDRTSTTWFKRAANKGKPPESGGARKASIGPRRKLWLAMARKLWADTANKALEDAGFDERIDHRSFVDQGITDRMPQPHLGPRISAMEKKGVRTERGDRYNAAKEHNAEVEEIQAKLADLNERKALLAKMQAQGVAVERPVQLSWKKKFPQKYAEYKKDRTKAQRVYFVIYKSNIQVEMINGYKMWEDDNFQHLHSDLDDIKIWDHKDENKITLRIPDDPEKMEKAVALTLQIAQDKKWDLETIKFTGSHAFVMEGKRQAKKLIRIRDEKAKQDELLQAIKTELDPNTVLAAAQHLNNISTDDYICEPDKDGVNRIRRKDATGLGPNVIDFAKDNFGLDEFGKVIKTLKKGLEIQRQTLAGNIAEDQGGLDLEEAAERFLEDQARTAEAEEFIASLDEEPDTLDLEGDIDFDPVNPFPNDREDSGETPK